MNRRTTNNNKKEPLSWLKCSVTHHRDGSASDNLWTPFCFFFTGFVVNYPQDCGKKGQKGVKSSGFRSNCTGFPALVRFKILYLHYNRYGAVCPCVSLCDSQYFLLQPVLSPGALVEKAHAWLVAGASPRLILI